MAGPNDPNWYERYSAADIFTFRVRIPEHPGALAEALALIGAQGAHVGDVSLVGIEPHHKIRDVQVFLVDTEQHHRVQAALTDHPEIDVVEVLDQVLEVHRGGAIETKARVRLETLMDLRMAYTPGVAKVCQRIAAEPEAAWDFTAVGNKIAIVTSGTAVLGLGNVGALAGLPVMEGKAAILDRFVGVSAEPILVDSEDPQEIVDIVAKCASAYGAIQLEDISAPACFFVERELQARLDKPVFHDDQHGTATVCVAGLTSALEVVSRTAAECEAVVLGSGAAGSAIARFLLELGVADVIVVDSKGAVFRDRDDKMNEEKRRLAEVTNKNRVKGDLAEVMKGRNLFVGVSKPNIVTPEMVRSMSPDPIVFALANPVSEISIEAAKEAGAAVAMDGRSMNNALAYPGIFRGALDARARRITPRMMLAAATTLSGLARERGQLLPDMMDMRVHREVTASVRAAAE